MKIVAGLILSATVLMAQGTAAPPPPELPSFARLDDKVAHDQIASAAAELAAIATQAGSTQPALSPSEAAILGCGVGLTCAPHVISLIAWP